MITKRLLVVTCCLALGLGGVVLVPTSAKLQPAGIVLTLPDRIGTDWSGQDVPVTEKELTALSADTGFARKVYTNSRGDQIYVGIVLSGEDMSNSIHRPERCLVAQGWNLLTPERTLVSVTPGSAPSLEAMRLRHSRQVQTMEGKPFNLRDVTYYWFIGSHDRTASHWTRTFYDVRDRLLHGENQRWAYVTIEARVTEGISIIGEDKDGRKFRMPQRNEAETIKLVEDFIPQVVPAFARNPENANDPIAGL